ncbi:MAG: hypothetical protein CVT80_00270 [Alphaproteobacteria bacterium HGW-Alphaproteobacteria-2]|nr:MAG: hypothetical protein CVT80_00270 [Alphaproteobacteria bacterium HGW-Alphaproteobacteria-2]
MRDLPQPVLTHLATRRQLATETLIWIIARNRQTGAPAPAGFWSGAYESEFTIAGEPRLYHGAGVLTDAVGVVSRKGLDVQRQEVRVSGLAPEVLALIRLYDLRGAPFQIHQAHLDPETMSLLAEPHLETEGAVETLEELRPAPGGEGGVTLRLASGMRALTFTVPLKKSDEAQKMRGGDRFRRYGDISGSVQTIWGEKKAEPKK